VKTINQFLKKLDEAGVSYTLTETVSTVHYTFTAPPGYYGETGVGNKARGFKRFVVPAIHVNGELIPLKKAVRKNRKNAAVNRNFEVIFNKLKGGTK
jgi:hypothetical protein